jgi:broad specificity phosphatase PhoE
MDIAKKGERRPGSDRGQRPGSFRVYLARHGRTPLNAAGVLRGRLDPPLDEVGRDEARRLGRALARCRPSTVVASPLLRARETAREVADLVGLPVRTDLRLVDRGYGQWAGMRREVVERRWGSLDGAPGVEPADAVRHRAFEAMEALAREGGGPAVVVSHDVVNRLLLSMIDPRLGDPDDIPQTTGCCNVLERGVDGWSVAAVAELPPAVGPLAEVGAAEDPAHKEVGGDGLDR